jgi:hypothetical protein
LAGAAHLYLGDQFTIIALLWFVLQLTGSGAALGLVILCFDLSGVVTGTILGRLLDRSPPRLVMGYEVEKPILLQGLCGFSGLPNQYRNC